MKLFFKTLKGQKRPYKASFSKTDFRSLISSLMSIDFQIKFCFRFFDEGVPSGVKLDFAPPKKA